MPCRRTMEESAWGRRRWRHLPPQVGRASNHMHELSIAMSIVEMAQEEALAARSAGQRGAPQAGSAVRRGEGSSALVLRNGVRRHSAARVAAGHRRGAGGDLLSRLAKFGVRSVRCNYFAVLNAARRRRTSFRAKNSKWSHWRYSDESGTPVGRSSKECAEAERRGRPRASQPLPCRGGVRGQPGFEPRVGQDGFSRKDADAAARSLSCGRAGWRSGDGE